MDVIRYNKKTQHPSWVFGKKNRYYKSAGLTHSSSTFDKNNIPLSQNPNSKDIDSDGILRKSYVNSEMQVQRISTYDNLRGEYKLAEQDKNKIRQYFAIKNYYKNKKELSQDISKDEQDKDK